MQLQPVFANVIIDNATLPVSNSVTEPNPLDGTILQTIHSIISSPTSFSIEFGMLSKPKGCTAMCAVLEIDGNTVGQYILRDIGEVLRIKGVESDGQTYIRRFEWKPLAFALLSTPKKMITKSRRILNALGSIKISFHHITSNIISRTSLQYEEDLTDFDPTPPVIMYTTVPQAKNLSCYVSLSEPKLQKLEKIGEDTEFSSEKMPRYVIEFRYRSAESLLNSLKPNPISLIQPITPEAFMTSTPRNTIYIPARTKNPIPAPIRRFTKEGFAIPEPSTMVESPVKKKRALTIVQVDQGSDVELPETDEADEEQSEILTKRLKTRSESSSLSSVSSKSSESPQISISTRPNRPNQSALKPPSPHPAKSSQPSDNQSSISTEIQTSLNELIKANRKVLEINLTQQDLEFRIALGKSLEDPKVSGLIERLKDIDEDYFEKKRTLDGLKGEWDLKRRREGKGKGRDLVI